jgi:hypothetical protein
LSFFINFEEEPEAEVALTATTEVLNENLFRPVEARLGAGSELFAERRHRVHRRAVQKTGGDAQDQELAVNR